MGLVLDCLLSFLDVGPELDNALERVGLVETDKNVVGYSVDQVEGDFREDLGAELGTALGFGLEEHGDHAGRIDVRTLHHDDLHEGVQVAADGGRCVRLEAGEPLQPAFVGDDASVRQEAVLKPQFVGHGAGVAGADELVDRGGRVGSGAVAVDGHIDGVVEHLDLVLDHDPGHDEGDELDAGPTNELVGPVEAYTVLGDSGRYVGPADVHDREVTTLVDAEAAAGSVGAHDFRIVDLERGVGRGPGDGAGSCDQVSDVVDQVLLGPEGGLLEERREQDRGTGAVTLEEVLAGAGVDAAGGIGLHDDVGGHELAVKCRHPAVGIRLDELEELEYGHAAVSSHLVEIGGERHVGGLLVLLEILQLLEIHIGYHSFRGGLVLQPGVNLDENALFANSHVGLINLPATGKQFRSCGGGTCDGVNGPASNRRDDVANCKTRSGPYPLVALGLNRGRVALRGDVDNGPDCRGSTVSELALASNSGALDELLIVGVSGRLTRGSCDGCLKSERGAATGKKASVGNLHGHKLFLLVVR